jgi:putative AlgH/UPF0301 family transcriptional regulator
MPVSSLSSTTREKYASPTSFAFQAVAYSFLSTNPRSSEKGTKFRKKHTDSVITNDFPQQTATVGSGHIARWCLVYGGWSPGQLDDEMKRETWPVHPASIELAFQTPADQLWPAILQQKRLEV